MTRTHEQLSLASSKEIAPSPILRHLAIIPQPTDVDTLVKHTDDIAGLFAKLSPYGVRCITLQLPTTKETDFAAVGGFIQALALKLNEAGAVLRYQGTTEAFSDDIKRTPNATPINAQHSLILSIGDNGRGELVHALQRMIEEGIPASQVTEQVITQHLDFPDTPDIDMMLHIGEDDSTFVKLPNTALYQGAYAEHVKTHRNFAELLQGNELIKLIENSFGKRDRRFGGLPK